MDIICKGREVVAHYGSCSMGGMFTYETVLFGKIIKTNPKSIRVEFTEEANFKNGAETSRRPVKITASFRFWKMLSNGKYVYASKIGCSKYLITF